jgi:fructose-1,6-bisphosphatase/inositol monophosphatase family enzyme
VDHDRRIDKVDTILAEVFENLGRDIRRRVETMSGLSALRTKVDGDTTHAFDSMAEERIVQALERAGVNAVVSSEESDDFVIGDGNEYLVIVDPIDGSDMVARGYPLASTAISIIDRSKEVPVYSRIYEIFTGCHFVAKDGSATRNGRLMRPSKIDDLASAFIVSYSATLARRTAPAMRPILDTRSSLFLNYGGPLDIAKVGSGQCEAVVESIKGFPPRDLIPGLHIAMCAGAVAADLDGNPLPLAFDRDSRCTFVAAANAALLDQLLAAVAVAA